MADQFPSAQNFYDAEKDLRTMDAVSNSKDPDTGAEIDTWLTRRGGQTDTLAGRLKKIGIERVGDFTTGCTVTKRNQGVLEVGGSVYVWLGVIPTGGKIVPPGSTPASTGGISPTGWLDVGDSSVLGMLSDPLGLSLIGECSDVVAMRAITGASGKRLELASYNAGWAALSTPPTGGGKFRWVEDNALIDDGVFVFKPSGASGAWVRQYQRKVTPYLAGAKGDNVDDSAAMLRCFDVAKAKRLNVHVDKGQYKYTQTPEIGPECSVTGEFLVAELFPVGCDGVKLTSSDSVGGRKIGGFKLTGTGANSAGFTAIVVDPGQDVIKRTTGVSFEDIQIFNLKTAVNAKNLWHSSFRSFNATNVCNGIIFRGRCISNEIGSGTKIVRGNGALVSGECIGVQFIESSDYTPAAPARPEGCSITSSVLVFGFDVAVDVDSMLAGGIFGADLDYCRSYGVRYRAWDGRPTCAPNWVAGDAAYSGQPFTGVGSVAVGTQRAFGPDIKQATMMVFNGNAGDAGIKLNSLNGRANISDCLISQTIGIGIYDNGGRFNSIKNNRVNSPTPLFLFSTGGNAIDGNDFAGGAIVNNSPIGRNLWGKNTGESCTEDTLIVPIAAGQLSGTLSLSSLGYSRGVPNVGLKVASCFYSGTASPGNTWAEISSDGMTITAYKTITFAAASELYVRVSIA